LSIQYNSCQFQIKDLLGWDDVDNAMLKVMAPESAIVVKEETIGQDFLIN
jgi:hypothetical protein